MSCVIVKWCVSYWLKVVLCDLAYFSVTWHNLNTCSSLSKIALRFQNAHMRNNLQLLCTYWMLLCIYLIPVVKSSLTINLASPLPITCQSQRKTIFAWKYCTCFFNECWDCLAVQTQLNRRLRYLLGCWGIRPLIISCSFSCIGIRWPRITICRLRVAWCCLWCSTVGATWRLVLHLRGQWSPCILKVKWSGHSWSSHDQVLFHETFLWIDTSVWKVGHS